MGIIIQSVTVSWNKEYRGGAAASERNSIPESFELPLKACIDSDENRIAVHEIRCSSYNGFKIAEKVYSIEASEIKIKGALVIADEQLLQVYFKYSYDDCGTPYRSYHDKTGTIIPVEEKAFDLYTDEYGRIAFNGRYTDFDTGNWWYEKTVHNIIRTNKSNRSIFIKNDVSKKYEQYAILK